ncbi:MULTISPECIES: limonene-1,2-epoxide hydrolase family protein [unclassified Pseudonocardia]|uniref:limonene-1,2-epoxide hydrolase family protein n=1 Tax=unclassified Pseudonocardia TaxID=2619320 RepID=UPI0001FFDE08|nr:limonene-1,2-epoxide hydrolase family protein [Pseudonocardia sp. Ae707_Ps1]OLM08926.1 Limonene-1,2-epoxide hydrolase [Pseudonocardia sp. Ae707_Ps1]
MTEMSTRPTWADTTTAAARPEGADEELVLAFFAELPHGDPARLERYLAPEAMYQNMPLPPAHGRDAVLQTLTALFQVMSMDHIDTLHLASRDGYVFTERVDVLTALPTGKSFALPVTGVTRVVGGLITEWRDYFDLREFEEAVGLPLRG